MIVHFGTASVRAEWRSATLCIGVFDGVHLGHQQVVARAVEDAHAQGRPALVLTFDRHPARILRPDRAPAMVATLGQNLSGFAALGVDVTVVHLFDAAVASLTAQSFFDDVFVGVLRAGTVVIGHDFAFGAGRTGTREWLAARIPTVVEPPYEHNGVRVSSTEVRKAVGEGRLEDAQTWLGRPFSLAGVVVQGAQLGRTLGYPTINLEPVSWQLVPGDGVYAGRATTPFGSFSAAVSVGRRETVGGDREVIEAYLLDYPGESLYGRAIELEFHARLRGQEKFENVEALVVQMGRDVQKVANMRLEANAWSRHGVM